jgi:hypothetical protein
MSSESGGFFKGLRRMALGAMVMGTAATIELDG